MRKKVTLENPQLADKIGKYSYLKILWKDFKKELPPLGKQIFVIINLKKGYYPVTAEYMSWAVAEKRDEKGVILNEAVNFRHIRFDDFRIPEIYIGSPDAKKLIAWGVLENNDTYK